MFPANGVTVRLSNWLRRRNGQSLVETALVFPIFVALLIGAVDLGLVANASVEVANAAKAGVIYAVQNGATASDSPGIQTAAAADAPNRTLTTTSSISCICSDGTASTCLNTDCPNSHMEEIVTVNTQATIAPLIHLPLLPASFTVKGQAIQKCLQ